MLEGWKIRTLGELGSASVGLTYSPDQVTDEPGTIVLRSSNVQGASISLEDNVYVSCDVPESSLVREGDILVCVRNGSRSLIGKSALIGKDESGFAFGAFMAVFRSRYNDFVFQLLQSEAFNRQVHESLGATINQITNKNLRSFKFLFPPLLEQRRIAEILGTWDEAIEKLEALRTAKETRRKGILQSLLHIDRVYPSHWDVKPLKKIATRIQRKNDGGAHPVLTISAKSGFLMQSDKFARDMAGSSVDRYTLLYKGEFAFNKGNSKTAPFGCIFPLNRPSAVIPFVYYCFKLNDELHSAFYTHLFAAGVLNHELSRLINSGVRNDGLFNLYADDFFGCQVPVPPIEEQIAIAQAITAINAELDLIDAETDALQRQKRGLMQKLLTGEWRVGMDDATEAAE